jgi:hypothetical protein
MKKLSGFIKDFYEFFLDTNHQELSMEFFKY